MIVNFNIVLCKVMCAYVLGQILRALLQYILKQVIFFVKRCHSCPALTYNGILIGTYTPALNDMKL